METNKNRKYSSRREKHSLLKKTNESDKAVLLLKVANLISAIKVKHLN
jgi:hypothetical protein